MRIHVLVLSYFNILYYRPAELWSYEKEILKNSQLVNEGGQAVDDIPIPSALII